MGQRGSGFGHNKGLQDNDTLLYRSLIALNHVVLNYGSSKNTATLLGTLALDAMRDYTCLGASFSSLRTEVLSLIFIFL